MLFLSKNTINIPLKYKWFQVNKRSRTLDIQPTNQLFSHTGVISV